MSIAVVGRSVGEVVGGIHVQRKSVEQLLDGSGHCKDTARRRLHRTAPFFIACALGLRHHREPVVVTCVAHRKKFAIRRRLSGEAHTRLDLPQIQYSTTLLYGICTVHNRNNSNKLLPWCPSQYAHNFFCNFLFFREYIRTIRCATCNTRSRIQIKSRVYNIHVLIQNLLPFSYLLPHL